MSANDSIITDSLAKWSADLTVYHEVTSSIPGTSNLEIFVNGLDLKCCGRSHMTLSYQSD